MSMRAEFGKKSTNVCTQYNFVLYSYSITSTRHSRPHITGHDRQRSTTTPGSRPRNRPRNRPRKNRRRRPPKTRQGPLLLLLLLLAQGPIVMYQLSRKRINTGAPKKPQATSPILHLRPRSSLSLFLLLRRQHQFWPDITVEVSLREGLQLHS